MLLIAFMGGILTILSPCILPVVPLLFARAYHSLTSMLLSLGGMTLTFALTSSMAVVGSEWVAQASNAGRQVALVIMAMFALSLMSSRVSAWLARPLVKLGNRLDPAGHSLSGPLASLLAGVATGLLWAPCAGPILGVILSSAMLNGANAGTSLLLLAYGMGTALSLGTVIFAGRGLANRLRPTIRITGWLRRSAGLVVLLAAIGISTGADNVLLASTSSQTMAAVEQRLLETVPKAVDYVISKVSAESAPEGATGQMPSLSGAVEWLNSPPLTSESLRGKVVLVDFWTFDCINCKHTLPYVNSWAKKYEKDGLVVIGVHTPEYGFEKVLGDVREQVRQLGINYPVAIDNNYAIWRSFNNQYWPAHYLIDATGKIRYSHFGEGRYETQEKVIQKLLEEAKVQATLATPRSLEAD